MLGVAGLVEEGPPVVRSALRLHHEHDAARHLDRRAERSRVLVGALLEVELDVLLRAQVDAEVGEGALERRKHPVAGELLIPRGAPPGATDVPASELAEADPDA